MDLSPSDNSYKIWTNRSGIEASKVEIKSVNDGDERGLFATDEIFPGERFLYIPSACLIGQDMIQKIGSQILHDKETTLDWQTPQGLELAALAMIEELRQRLLQEDEASTCMVKRTAQSLEYQWRNDDAVALYLMACRVILNHVESSSDTIKPISEAPSEQHTAEQEPVIVEGIVPLGSNDQTVTTSTAAVFEMDQGHHHDVVVDASVVVAEGQEHNDGALHDAPPSRDNHDFPSFLPHVEMLPKSFPTNPLYFSKQELSRLEGTNLYTFVNRMHSQMETDWFQLSAILRAHLADDERSFICPKCDQEEEQECYCQMLWNHLTLQDYKWALSNVYSRCTDFELTHRQDDHVCRRVMAPVFDMMNHDFASQVTHAMDKEGNIGVYNSNSSESILPGQEVFLMYGHFPNEKFLLVYGFAIPDNPHDGVQIYAPISPSDPLYESKARLLLTCCGIDDSQRPHLLYKEGSRSTILPETLLSVLRIVGIQSEEELQSVASDNPHHGDGVDMISQDNEQGALMALGNALHVMARQLALNLISDDNLQAASDLQPVRPRLAPVMEEEEEEGDEDDESAGAPTDKQLQALETSAQERKGVNLTNIKTLCQSEYTILQAALAEISERLERLQHDSDPVATVAGQ